MLKSDGPNPGSALQDDTQNFNETLKALRKPSFFRSSMGLLGDWILIVATLVLIRIINHPVAYVAGAFLIGVFQQRLGVIGHEAVHHLLSQNRRLNDFVGNVFCFWPLGTSVLGYRRFHFMHHKYTNTPNDPEWKHTKSGPWNIPTPMRQMILYTMKDLSGLSLRDMIVVIRLTYPPTFRSAIGPALLSILFVLLSVATGNLWLPLVWYGGLYTSFWAVLRVRIWFEHTGILNTHRVHFPWLARWVISPHNIWVHWEHHKYSSIPYWNLLKVRDITPEEPVLAFSTLLAQFHGKSLGNSR